MLRSFFQKRFSSVQAISCTWTCPKVVLFLEVLGNFTTVVDLPKEEQHKLLLNVWYVGRILTSIALSNNPRTFGK